VELIDIEKKYLLTLANLKLLQFTTSTRSTGDFSHRENFAEISEGSLISAKDAVTLLTENNLFDTAASLAKLFQFDWKIIFEILTNKCLQLDLDLSGYISSS
jgi:hypothetical protein